MVRPIPIVDDTPGGAEVIRPSAFRRRELPDAQLVQEAQGGNMRAQEAIFDRYGADVERVSLRILGRDDELADVVQDVFVQVFRNLGRLRDPEALQAWIRAVTVATARKVIRRRGRRRWLRFLPTEEVPEVAALPADDEVLAALRATYAILDAMSADLRIAFALRHLDQLELTEVAAACGVSLATIKRRLRRADVAFAARARRDPHLVDWVAHSRWEDTP